MNLGRLSANFSDQFDVITNSTAAGKYIPNVDVCHMVTVVYLLRVPSFVTRPMLCPSILPRLYYHVCHWSLFRKAAALRVIFIILNNDSQQLYQYQQNEQ